MQSLLWCSLPCLEPLELQLHSLPQPLEGEPSLALPLGSRTQQQLLGQPPLHMGKPLHLLLAVTLVVHLLLVLQLGPQMLLGLALAERPLDVSKDSLIWLQPELLFLSSAEHHADVG